MIEKQSLLEVHLEWNLRAKLSCPVEELDY